MCILALLKVAGMKGNLERKMGKDSYTNRAKGHCAKNPFFILAIFAFIIANQSDS